jgi:hypothetical protein
MDVCYGNDKFVVINGDLSTGSDKAAYSTDGIKWVETKMPGVAKWYSVCYSGD